MNDGDKTDWYAPPELAGVLKVKVGRTEKEIANMEAIAQSLGWKVAPREKCPDCERIKQKRK